MNNNDLNGNVLGSTTLGDTTNMNNNTLNNTSSGVENLGSVESLEQVNNNTNLNTMQPNQMQFNQVQNNQMQPNQMQPNQMQNNQNLNNVNNTINPGVSTSNVMPEAAYTNPQNITPTPMPGFESSSVIGTTPPMQNENRNANVSKEPKKKGSKVLFIIIVVVLLCGVGLGTYYVLNYTDLLNKKPTVTIEVKDLSLNVGDKFPSIDEVATITGTDVSNCNVISTDVNTNKEGEYSYSVHCGEVMKTGKVTVVDNTTIELNTKTVYKIKNGTVNAKDFVNNYDSKLTYSFVSEDSVKANLQNVGTYKVSIKATSSPGKESVSEATLVVLEYEIKGYVKCATNEQAVTGTSANSVISYNFAIANDGANGYGKIANVSYTFKFTDETEYDEVLSKANNGVLTFNDITGSYTADKNSLTIVITKERTNEEATSEIGEENISKYSTIKNYYENTKGYKCSFEKIS